jgi:adenylate cyclase
LDGIENIDPVLRATIAALPSNDSIFSNSISRGPVVLGMGALRTEGNETPTVFRAAAALEDGGDPRANLNKYNNVLRSLDEIDNKATGRAVLTVVPERDGVVRRVPMVVNINGVLVPTLSLEMLRVAVGSPWFKVHKSATGVTGVSVPDLHVPTDPDGRAWVNFADHDSRRFISAADILSGNVDQSALQGRLVIVGTTGLGLQDFPSTPVTSAMPGVEIHAQLIETILDGIVLTRPHQSLWIELAVATIMGLLLILIVPILKSLWSVLILLLFVGSLGVATWFGHSSLLILFDATYPAISSAFLYLVLLGSFLVEVEHKYKQEMQEKERIAGVFGRYVSKDIVDEIVKKGQIPQLGGEYMQVTVLFSDIRNFTSLSEALDAQEIVRMLNTYFEEVCQIVLKEGGTIDKFIGDAIMVQFGAPVAHEDHADRAIRTALAMRQVARDFRPWLKQQFPDKTLPEFAIGVGMHTGRAVVGNIGSQARLEYTAIGDIVNSASRIEGKTKEFGCEILASSETLAAASLKVDVGQVQSVLVKGKEVPLQLHELLKINEDT